MALAEGQIRLAISITAHEELDTLLAQVRNLRWFCDDPLIVVHINRAFFAQIEEDAGLRRALRLLEEERGVLLNPHHIETRWAHMFHAHLSNFALLAGRGEAFTHVVLLSSADLFFRRGVEAHLRDLDASQTSWPLIPVAELDTAPGYWIPMVREDAHFLDLVAARGLTHILHGPHEGSFFARGLMEEMARILERHVPDWDYDTRYPKEEFFLQTLLQEHGSARLGRSLAHVLVIGSSAERDRRAVALVLREAGALDPAGGTPVDEWSREVLEGPAPGGDDPLHRRFVLSRVPRQPDHPLRLLLNEAACPAAVRRMRAVARRLTAADVLKLDQPGAKAQANQAPAPATHGVVTALQGAKVQELLTPALGSCIRELAFRACPDAYHPPIEVTRSVSACAAYLPEPGAEARIGIRPGSLLSLAASPLPTPSEAAFFFLFFPVTLPAGTDGMLRVVLAPATPPPRAIWIEAHGPGGKRGFSLGQGMEGRGKDGEVEAATRLYPLPPELLALRGAPEWPAFLLYIAQGFGTPACRIASLGFLSLEG